MQVLAGIILLGVLIVFHELGHFLFAKWLGVRVLVFSVGFGPKIWGFKRGETEYRLSAIPLGGYVRMFGESLEEELSIPEQKMSFMHQRIWRKSLIAVAGPLFNFVLPIILFFFLSLGVEQVFAPRIGTLVKDGAAERAGLMPDDLIEAVNGKPVVSFNEVAQIVAQNPNVDLKLRIKRKNLLGQFEMLDLTVRPEGKSSSNPLEKDHTVGRIGIMPAIELPIVMVGEESPLKVAGLKSFDEIVEIDGKSITSANAMSAALATIKPGSTITVKRASGEQLFISAPTDLAMLAMREPIKVVHNMADDHFPIEVANRIDRTKQLLTEEQASWARNFGLARAKGAVTQVNKGSIADNLGLRPESRILSVDGEKILIPVQLQQTIMHDPEAPHVLGVMNKDGSTMVAVFTLPDHAHDKMNLNTDLLSLLGITTAEVFKSGEMIERHVGPIDALRRAVSQTWEIAWMTGKSLWLLVKRDVPASQIGGPIMLFDVAQQAAQKGLSFYIFIMCLLSVNLGLLNLLPIPALDGGHLLLFGIEAVQGRPLTARTRAIATQIGVAILLLIMAFAIFNDLSRLFR